MGYLIGRIVKTSCHNKNPVFTNSKYSEKPVNPDIRIVPVNNIRKKVATGPEIKLTILYLIAISSQLETPKLPLNSIIGKILICIFPIEIINGFENPLKGVPNCI